MAHFQGPNSVHKVLGLIVFIGGALQPLNAIVRPHAPENGMKPTAARVLWVYVHKGVGYGCILLGVVNLALGVSVAADKNFESQFVKATAAILGLSTATLVFIAAFKCKTASSSSSSSSSSGSDKPPFEKRERIDSNTELAPSPSVDSISLATPSITPQSLGSASSHKEDAGDDLFVKNAAV